MAVALSAPAGATIADGTATGTIADDDAQPTVGIGDGTAVEGNAVHLPVTCRRSRLRGDGALTTRTPRRSRPATTRRRATR